MMVFELTPESIVALKQVRARLGCDESHAVCVSLENSAKDYERKST